MIQLLILCFSSMVLGGGQREPVKWILVRVTAELRWSHGITLLRFL